MSDTSHLGRWCRDDTFNGNWRGTLVDIILGYDGRYCSRGRLLVSGRRILFVEHSGGLQGIALPTSTPEEGDVELDFFLVSIFPLFSWFLPSCVSASAVGRGRMVGMVSGTLREIWRWMGLRDSLLG